MAKITERRGYHVLAWTDPITGKRNRTSLGKVGTIPKRDLDTILRAKEYETSTGARLLSVHRQPAPRFSAFVRDYLLWHQAEFPDSDYRTAQIIEDHLLPEFGLTPLNLLTVKQVEDYKLKRRGKVRASTIEKELRTLQAVVNRAVDLKILHDNPISIVQPPRNLDSRPHRWYSAEELEALYAACGDNAAKYDVADYAPVWRLFANTGLRRGEAMLLRWTWVREKTIRIVSTGEERTKDGEWRDVPLTVGALQALKQLARSGEYVLPRIAYESLSRAALRDAGRAGLDGSLHTLRHTYICHLLLAGVPVRTVQLYAGHASIATTEKYAYQVLRNDPDAAVRLAI